MNDLPSVGSGTVADGFRTILRATHYFIQVASDDLGLAVAEHLLKGRIAGDNVSMIVSSDDGHRTNVHQGLKILPLAVGFQVQPSIFAGTGPLVLPGLLYGLHGLLALGDISQDNQATGEGAAPVREG